MSRFVVVPLGANPGYSEETPTYTEAEAKVKATAYARGGGGRTWCVAEVKSTFQVKVDEIEETPA